jgi:hypothetical protein
MEPNNLKGMREILGAGFDTLAARLDGRGKPIYQRNRTIRIPQLDTQTPHGG